MTDGGQARRKHAQELLEKYRAGQVPKAKYSSMIVEWGKTQLVEARSEIEAFLKEADATLRQDALHALGINFGLEDYWPVAADMCLYDSDQKVREEAASVLGWLKRDTHDEQTLVLLASVVRDAYEAEQVRESAYIAMREVFHYKREEAFRLSSESYELEDEVDWKFVNAYVNSQWEEEERTKAHVLLEAYRAGRIAEQDYGSMLLRFGKTRLLKAQPDVEAFLKSSKVELRILALHVLVLYFQVPGNWQLAADALEHDPHLHVRLEAAIALGMLMEKTRDKRTLQILNKSMWGEDEGFGGETLIAMKQVFGGEDYDEIEAYLKSSDDTVPDGQE